MTTQTQTQTPATRTTADLINFENYALLYDDLTAAQADLDEETCRLPIWCIFPDDRELTPLWSEVISAGRSLAEFLDASDEKYSLPTSPAIMVGRYGAMEIGERRPFDNYELLQRKFPPPTRPELEARVLRFRDDLLAHYNRLMAKVRDILYSTRIHRRLMNSESGPLLLLGPLIFDEANFERFRLIFRNLENGDDYDFEHYVAVQEGCESLKAALEGMNQYWSVTDPRSEAFSLLMGYVAVADSYRDEMLSAIAGNLNFHLQSLIRLNPRWSHPGEPLFLWEDARDNATHPSAETTSAG